MILTFCFSAEGSVVKPYTLKYFGNARVSFTSLEIVDSIVQLEY